MDRSKINRTLWHSPIGVISLYADDLNLLSLSLNESLITATSDSVDNPILPRVIQQLKEYFSGDRKDFTLPINISRFSPFQVSVWEALLKIPYGETRSYLDIAKMINNPASYRAVGNACGKNHYPIIIPCHRVVSASGSLGGFSADLSIKKKLLALEQANK